MSSFSESALSKRLSEMNSTQQSVQTLSLWLIHHRKYSRTIVTIWSRELLKARKDKKLPFFYLANDVIQNSRKKGQEFVTDFMPVLPATLKHTAKEVDDKVRSSLERILSIWKERKIYEPDVLDMFWQAFERGTADANASLVRTDVEELDAAPKKKRKSEKAAVSLKEEVAKELVHEPDFTCPSAEELIRSIRELENSPSSDANVREKIAALPPEVSDANLLKNLRDKEEAIALSSTVDEAVILLDEYNSRLMSEIDDRKFVAKMLSVYLDQQKKEMRNDLAKLMFWKGKLSRLDFLRKELVNHLQSLPDLPKYEDITLSPLPSVGELFSQK